MLLDNLTLGLLLSDGGKLLINWMIYSLLISMLLMKNITLRRSKRRRRLNLKSCSGTFRFDMETYAHNSLRPQYLEFTAADAMLALENIEALRKIGFRIMIPVAEDSRRRKHMTTPAIK